MQVPSSNKPTQNVYLSLFNPLNAESNPFCYLLALLGAHHILHVSRIWVNHSPSYPLTYSLYAYSNVVKYFHENLSLRKSKINPVSKHH